MFPTSCSFSKYLLRAYHVPDILRTLEILHCITQVKVTALLKFIFHWVWIDKKKIKNCILYQVVKSREANEYPIL